MHNTTAALPHSNSVLTWHLLRAKKTQKTQTEAFLWFAVEKEIPPALSRLHQQYPKSRSSVMEEKNNEIEYIYLSAHLQQISVVERPPPLYHIAHADVRRWPA